ncbi:hypothetical protein PCANC_07696 [Puccinia coronata f. sp. avenae]|uniref:Uncharacterized protein n=1 Tax=Puccinia coronata f. sp. avenae TaxID=200324 RepID=A0A2N5VRE8_9BASI|nr:hypothetical protein PCANC_07696 [Puccinia coronata f. sp. avenae]
MNPPALGSLGRLSKGRYVVLQIFDIPSYYCLPGGHLATRIYILPPHRPGVGHSGVTGSHANVLLVDSGAHYSAAGVVTRAIHHDLDWNK